MSEPTPIRVALLGSEAAGKTCFLAALGVLGEAGRDSAVHARGLDPASVDFLDSAAGSLRRQAWPPATTLSRLLLLRIELDGFTFNLRTLDYPGEDFRDAVRRLDAERAKELVGHLSEADVLLLLFDPQVDLIDGAKGAEEEVRHQRLLAHLTAVQELVGARRRSPDVGVVLTKMDRTPEVRSSREARNFFRSRTGALEAKLLRHADALEYFAVSAVGATTTVERAGRTMAVPSTPAQPFGFDGVFRWMLQRRRSRKAKPRRLAAAFGLVAVVAAVVGWIAWDSKRAEHERRLLADPNLAAVEKLEQTASGRDALASDRSSLLRKRLDELAGRIARSSTENELQSLSDELSRLKAANPGSLESRVAELGLLVRDRIEAIELAAAKEAVDAGRGDAETFLARYIERFPASRNRSTVERWTAQIRDRKLRESRDRMRMIVVADADSMRRKGEAVAAFLSANPSAVDAQEAARMRRAAELAAQFASPCVYRVQIRKSGGFTTGRRQKIRIEVGGKQVRELAPAGSPTLAYLDDGIFEITWQAGQSVEASIWTQSRNPVNFSFYLAAHKSDIGPVALRALTDAAEAVPAGDWRSVFADGGPILQIDVPALKPADWQAVADYIHPGDKW